MTSETRKDPNAMKKTVMAELKEIISDSIQRDFHISISPESIFFNRPSSVVFMNTTTANSDTCTPPRKVRYEYYPSTPEYKPYISLFATGGIWGWPCAKAREAPELFRNGKLKVRASILPPNDDSEVNAARVGVSRKTASTNASTTTTAAAAAAGGVAKEEVEKKQQKPKKPKTFPDRAMTEAMLTPATKDKILKKNEEEGGEGNVSLMESLSYNRRLRKDGPFLEKIKTVDSAKKKGGVATPTPAGMVAGERRRRSGRNSGVNGGVSGSGGKKSVYVEEETDTDVEMQDAQGEEEKKIVGGGTAKKARAGRGRPPKGTPAAGSGKVTPASAKGKGGKSAVTPAATNVAAAAAGAAAGAGEQRQQGNGQNVAQVAPAAAAIPQVIPPAGGIVYGQLVLVEDHEMVMNDPQMKAAIDLQAEIIRRGNALSTEEETTYNEFLQWLDGEEAQVDEELAYIERVKPILIEKIRQEKSAAAKKGKMKAEKNAATNAINGVERV